MLPFTRVIAINADGRNFRLLSNRETAYSRGLQLGGGDVIDLAPVLLSHGAMDVNVSIGQSRRMADRLKAAGKTCELVTWDNLDHGLDDSSARARMLRASERERLTVAVQEVKHVRARRSR
jgi:acetyl esterase/lipase